MTKLSVDPIKIPVRIQRAGPSKLSRDELAQVLEDTLDGAAFRRSKSEASELPLYGHCKESKVPLDVIASLYNGQLIALSTTFTEELLKALRGP